MAQSAPSFRGGEVDVQEIGDRMALRSLVDHYSSIPDDREYALVDELFTADAVFTGPGFRMQGRDQIRQIMCSIERYEVTLHVMHQQRVEIERPDAAGDVYCVATHIERNADERTKIDWGIRYQDRYRLDGSTWRIAERELRLAWEQRSPLAPS